METFKTARQWLMFLALCIPILIISALYFQETFTLPTYKIATDGQRWGRARDSPPVELIRYHAQHSTTTTLSIRPDNLSDNPTVFTNASHSTHDNRTLTSDLRPDDIQGDVFVFSKQSLEKQSEDLKSGVATSTQNGSVSIVINNGGMLVEDVPAMDPSREEKQVSDPLIKDLSGYVSVINSRNHMYVNCTSCAYVSSSGQLKGSKAGQLINSYPCVIRMNNAPTDGYERDVGSKTTVRVVAHSAIKPVITAKRSLLKDPGQPKFLVVWGPERQMQTNGKGSAYNIAKQLSKEFSKDGMQVFVFSQRQVEYADKVFEIETGRNRLSSGSWLSTGWFTMILSRAICQEITVFGMVTEDHCKKNPTSKVPYHYYQAPSSGQRECSMYNVNEKAKKNGHRFMTEKSVFARWSNLEPKISFKYPDWSSNIQ